VAEVGVLEARELVLENEVDLTDRAVALLGDDELSAPRVLGARRGSSASRS
jgi:hypothetical protein